MRDRSHHPRVESAMTTDDVEPGVAYVTYIPGDHVIERGTFTSTPSYDGETDDRWTATAEVKLGGDVIAKTVYLFDMGVTPDETGERWAEAVTVMDDSDSSMHTDNSK